MAHPFQADITPACTRRGTLVYVAGGDTAGGRTLVWMDRQGNAEPLGLVAPSDLTKAVP